MVPLDLGLLVKDECFELSCILVLVLSGDEERKSVDEGHESDSTVSTTSSSGMNTDTNPT